MKKLLSVVAAVSLAFLATGCSKDTTPPATPTVSIPTSTVPTAETTSSVPTVTTTSDLPSDPPSETPSTTPSDTTPSTGSVTPSAGATTAPPRRPVDQSTPEAAMTGWLNALLTGDSANVCALMASDDQAIADIPNAVETCGTTIEPMLKNLTPLKEMFKDLDIKGATVSGDTANFDSATTTPVMAAQIIKQFKAVKLNGKWFVTQ